jgi:pseudaminic acid cytidylyltransferase
MNIAVIPARGGSKRIPRKNLKLFCGKPIIAYSIEAARTSGLFDRIIVSSDDEEIIETALAYGAETPFRRPSDLSDDNTTTIPVIRHAIEWADQNWRRPDCICCIYATAPFVQNSDLRDGYKKLIDNPGTGFVFPATTFAFSIFRALKMNDDGTVGMFWPEHEITRSQDLPEAYHDAGQFYWGTRDAWLKNEGIFTGNARIVPLPPYRVQDIDTADDWKRAEIMFQSLSAETDEGHAKHSHTN